MDLKTINFNGNETIDLKHSLYAWNLTSTKLPDTNENVFVLIYDAKEDTLRVSQQGAYLATDEDIQEEKKSHSNFADEIGYARISDEYWNGPMFAVAWGDMVDGGWDYIPVYQNADNSFGDEIISDTAYDDLTKIVVAWMYPPTIAIPTVDTLLQTAKTEKLKHNTCN